MTIARMRSLPQYEVTKPLRRQMVAALRAQGITNETILTVMEELPREMFLSPAFRAEAYTNQALPIGESQTISMPYVVARMTHALDVQPHHKVLEIGTGSGYQAAILSRLVRRLFSVERLPALSRVAEQRFQELGLFNIVTKVGDGTLGWQEQAPFDRIMVTAASPSVPRSLLEQLGDNGILVIPVGDPAAEQQVLMKYYRREDGSFGEYKLGPVRFVPLIGVQGVPEKAHGKG